MEKLTPRDSVMLAFEDAHTGVPEGFKVDAIQRTFGFSPTRYYQLLLAIIDTEAALEHNPMLVKRLQRERDAATAQRASRRFRTA